MPRHFEYTNWQTVRAHNFSHGVFTKVGGDQNPPSKFRRTSSTHNDQDKLSLTWREYERDLEAASCCGVGDQRLEWYG